MIQSIEILLLSLVQAFFALPVLASIITFGVLGAVLIILQFQNKENYTYGIGAVLSIVVVALHGAASEWVIEALHAHISSMYVPHDNEPVFILFEPFFSIFVAPAEYRFRYQEIIFVWLAVYLGFVAWHGYQSYKKTGILIGELNPAILFQSNVARPERSDFNELGSGNLASTDDILNWTKPRPNKKEALNADTILQVKELRGAQGMAFKRTQLVIPREERNRHILAVAKTGSGKTTKLILPVLYNDVLCPQSSTIVIDSKPEMWEKLANLTRKYSPHKNIMLFNPLDVARSLSWNILSKIEDDTDAKLIANTIILATDNPAAKSDSPFFRNNALALLNAIMVGLLSDKNDTLSMPKIHSLVQSGMKPLCDWLEAHPEALRTSKTFVELARSGSQNADTIMSELSMRIAAWDLKDIRITTAANEINLEDLIEKPSLFIIEFRESELEMLRPMANVIVIELLRFLTKRAERCKGHTLPRPVGFVIDEFASALGRLPDIHVKLNTLRSRNVSITAAIQSIAQVKANYGDDADSVLAGFSSKIFMPNLDVQDAEWASKETGQMTVRFQTKSVGNNRKKIEVFASVNDSMQEQVQQRAVLTPDEIGRPEDNRATFFLPNLLPFQGHLIPFYEIPEMLSRIDEASQMDTLILREKPIEYDDEAMAPKPVPAGGANGAAAGGSGGGAAGATNNGLPAGITDTRGWTEDKVREKLEETKKNLDWENTTGSAKKWWEAFENENKHRVALVLRLAEELSNRKATITEFFLAYVYSNTDNIQANLYYLDYTRLKKEEERKKKEAKKAAAAKNSGQAPGAQPAA